MQSCTVHISMRNRSLGSMHISKKENQFGNDKDLVIKKQNKLRSVFKKSYFPLYYFLIRFWILSFQFSESI